MVQSMVRWCWVAFLASALLAQSNTSPSRAQSSNPDVESRVNGILSRMTVEQKVDMLGGVNGFYIRGYKDLGLPEQKMSDGPVGLRNYGPSTTMGGIGLAASWNPEARC